MASPQPDLHFSGVSVSVDRVSGTTESVIAEKLNASLLDCSGVPYSILRYVVLKMTLCLLIVSHTVFSFSILHSVNGMLCPENTG